MPPSKQITVAGLPWWQVVGDDNQARTTYYKEQQTGSPCSPDENIGRTEGQGNMRLWVPWANRQQAALDFVGYSTVAGKAGTNYISRINPWSNPDYDGYLYVERLGKIEGGPIPLGNAAASPTGVAQFDYASIQLMFHTPIWGIMSDAALQAATGGTFPDESKLLRNVIIDYQPGGKYQTLPAFGSVVFANTSSTPYTSGPTDFAVAHQNILLAQADYSVTWLDVPLAGLNIPQILSTIGKSNLHAFGNAAAPGGVMPPEALVCLFPKIGPPHRMVNGAFAYDVQFRFKVYPQNVYQKGTNSVITVSDGGVTYNIGAANALYRYTTGQFEPVRIKPNNNVDDSRIFPRIDYALMFQPP